tara:strand:- start:1431 stop:1991 length:561 start_codon:yes stop_codon:yes gene_type:complete
MESLFKNEIKQKLGGRNLFLIGMMGSGKSTIGKYLAKSLRYKYIDIDKMIEELLRKDIKTIFLENGEEEFRRIEFEVLQQISTLHSCVISTGGGIVVRTQNWGCLRQGIVIWLNVEKSILIERLKKDYNNRPLIEINNIENTVNQILVDRKSLYNQADLQCNLSNESPEKVTNIIIQNLSKLISSD